MTLTFDQQTIRAGQTVFSVHTIGAEVEKNGPPHPNVNFSTLQTSSKRFRDQLRPVGDSELLLQVFNMLLDGTLRPVGNARNFPVGLACCAKGQTLTFAACNLPVVWQALLRRRAEVHEAPVAGLGDKLQKGYYSGLCRHMSSCHREKSTQAGA